MLEAERCAACGAASLTPHLAVAGEAGPDGLIPSSDRFGTALADIVRCRSCGHMQLSPMPSEELLSHGYATAESEEYVEEEAGQRETARRTLELIERYAPGNRALLDLGSWVGFLLAEARERGWERTLGVEPSEFASAFARDRLSLEVITGDLFTVELEARSFDAITMGDVIEHLISPAEALARMRGLLTPGGVVWLALPDAGSRVARTLGKRWWSVLPTHVQYFTRSSIAALLERSGFELLATATAPKAFTVGYYLGRIGGYSPAAGRALAGAAARAGVADRMWAPDFRDRMAVVARPR
ncbi:MAG TPA: class I SAM-dependent methyltransferase [Solirubrobacteraceae bacterium]|nr:class I SAM-dependent methyltransferase [Solirubrobacteraceae bacterium]